MSINIENNHKKFYRVENYNIDDENYKNDEDLDSKNSLYTSPFTNGQAMDDIILDNKAICNLCSKIETKSHILDLPALKEYSIFCGNWHLFSCPVDNSFIV